MIPHCPTCLREMSSAACSARMFKCEPCREVVQVFSLGLGEGGPYVKLSRGQAPSSRAA